MKRIWLIIPWAIFALIAAGWVTYWNIAANSAEQRLRAAVTEQSATGASASIGQITRHGFPALLRLELHDVSYAPARGGWRATTPLAEMHVELLNPQHIIFKARAPIAVARSNGEVTNITADTLIASWRTSGEALAVAGIEADNLALDDPAKEGVLRAQKLVLNVRPDPRAAGQYQVAFDAQALTLPRPVRSFEAFGQDIAALRAAIVVEQADALSHGAEGDPLGPWREAGGKLRFEALVLNWGPLETTGHGEGSLDAERRLQGALTLPIEHPGPVLQAIARGENVSDDARRAIGLLATAFALSGDDITLDAYANNGVLRLEGISVRTLPPVY